MAKSIVVVGGSLAGLMHGLQHKRLGNNVVILEQETGERSGQEAGIGFGDAVNEFYSKYDATGISVAIQNHARRIAYRTRPEVYSNNNHLSLTSWGLMYRLLRANFDGMVSPACPNPPSASTTDGIASYLSGKRVSAFEYTPEKGQVIVHYTDVQTNEEKSLSADLLIGADGIHSTIRKLVKAPTLEQYAGYVSWRGTVPERDVSTATCEYFSDWLCLNLAKRGYLIGYIVPTDDGSFEPGERLINFVWYYNMNDSSAEMIEAFTDVHGQYHRKTVPRGLVKPEIWEIVRNKIQVAAPFAEVLAKVQAPFVTKINDAISDSSSFCDGHVILVGDAFASFRPHAAAATEQCAFQCQTLGQVYSGQKTMLAWEREARHYARHMVLLNRLIGDFGRGAVLSLLKTLIAYAIFLLWNKLRRGH
ncbi:FAD binding domain protein [Xylariaceae sp. FL1272]|nr:FAD binding domain protein [Xylariaceae sp. FL1272]